MQRATTIGICAACAALLFLFSNDAPAQIVRESCGFDGIVEDTPQDLSILLSQAPAGS